ncbi:MAG: nuclear transport factor 2 family protein [Dehalococcoidia bacterium]
MSPNTPTNVAATPADLNTLFVQLLRAGDIEGMANLYEPAAILVDPPSDEARGHSAIRRLLAAMVDGRAAIEISVSRCIEVGDTAVIHCDWRGTTAGPCGERRGIAGKSVQVARRQPEGNWLLIYDDPVARG